jgi:type IV pilus assembly protein PilY1
MKGTMWPNAVDPFVTAPTWPTPVSNTATMIDDLWHATINGRGQMYLAHQRVGHRDGDPAGLQDILSQTGAQGGVASAPSTCSAVTRAYFGTYNPAGWTGDLTANPINPSTGVVSGHRRLVGRALLLARDWTTRVIASFTTAAPAWLHRRRGRHAGQPVGNAWGSTADVMNYLRGDRTQERQHLPHPHQPDGRGDQLRAGGRRARTAWLRRVGRRHAACRRHRTDPGKELWAYVPRAVLPDIGQTTARGYAFKTQLDGSPVVGKTGASSKLLVAGMGAAGRSTTPSTSAARADSPKPRWPPT